MAAWNVNDAALDKLWQANDRPSSKTWKTIAKPLWDRGDKIEQALAPVLWDWARANKLAGLSPFGFVVGNYKQIREQTHLKVHGRVIVRWLEWAAEKETTKSLDEIARSMPDKKWEKYMKDFCTLSSEGLATKNYLMKARARLQPKRSEGGK